MYSGLRSVFCPLILRPATATPIWRGASCFLRRLRWHTRYGKARLAMQIPSYTIKKLVGATDKRPGAGRVTAAGRSPGAVRIAGNGQ